MKRLFTLSNLRIALEIVLVALLTFAVLSKNFTTQAADPQEPEAPDAVYWYVCNPPNHVAVFTNRVHVYCSTTSPVANAPSLNAAIFWFAVPTSPDSAAASRFMSLMQTAFITAKPIWLEVNPSDTSGSSFGCGAGDCRRIYGMEMR